MTGFTPAYSVYDAATTSGGYGKPLDLLPLGDADEPSTPLLAYSFFYLMMAFTTAGALPKSGDPFSNIASITTAGRPAYSGRLSSENAISELRRISGLNWDQLSRVFDVSRRTLHLWASGGTLNAGNEEKLYRILAVVRSIDRGTAEENRTALLGASSSGVIPLDLLIRGDFNRVASIVGKTELRRAPRQTSHSPNTSLPIALSDLMDTQHDVIHKELRGGRAAKTMRIRGSGKA